jgi:putative DNA primase/helicase
MNHTPSDFDNELIIEQLIPPRPAKLQDDRPPVFSDEALALAFAENHSSDLRFVAAWNKWMTWDGARWKFDDTLHAFNLARRVCRAAAGKCNTRAKKGLASARTVAAVVNLARADRRLAATADQWDADSWLINTPDGVVDLRTGEKRSHRQEDYMTKMTTSGPRGDCPKFKAFLNRIMGGAETLIAYLQRVYGYCLTGDVSEQAIFFNHGVGANGKTVMMSTVSGILGDYCVATPIETFTESKTDRHPTELARLRGARLVTATETEAGRHWAESRLKELTGGERIPARFMHKDFFEYLPAFKPVISGNHKPSLRSVGVAMRRRVNMIPFTVTIPQTERDPQLAEKLKAEWPGILQWMIVGCLDWQRRGLEPPDAVTKATDAYFRDQDSLSFWLEECCQRAPNDWTGTTALFSSWKAWAEKAGVRHGDLASFGEALAADGFVWKHKKTGNGYDGLRIRQGDDLPF